MKKTVTFNIDGMVCESCEKVISKQLKGVEGIKNYSIDYETQNATITFDENKIKLNQIYKKIEEKGYSCSKKGKGNILGWIFGTVGAIIAFYFIVQLVDSAQLPQISANMGYGLLFLVGLLTGFHCVSMCGGFVLSYTAKDAQEGKKSYKSHFMYGIGKTLSYTIIGAMFGLLGSIIAFTPMMRGIAGLLAGLFLILFGLRMLNVPYLRKIHFTTPKFISKFVGKETQSQSSPLIIGLLNGLMIACGPLQAIYIMAAGTGSVIEGAKLLFVFALGTLPVMLGFGFFSTFVSSKFTQKILKASGIIVIILGIIMINNGLTLTGSGYDLNSLISSVSATSVNLENSENVPTMEDGYQIIEMTVDRSGWTPDTFILEQDIPVKWVINAEELTGCNNAIQVPSLNLQFDLQQGEQTIEFTPTETGIVSWSCWMGMIPGSFTVLEDLDINAEELENTIDTATTALAASSSGGCGCCGG